MCPRHLVAKAPWKNIRQDIVFLGTARREWRLSKKEWRQPGIVQFLAQINVQNDQMLKVVALKFK